MTNEERIAFVRSEVILLKALGAPDGNLITDTVRRIVDKWENDIQDIKERNG